MYESLRSRIAALEEHEVQEEEEERAFGAYICADIGRMECLCVIAAEEAVKSVKGLEDSAVHAKYIELVRRVEGDIQCSLLMGSL